MQVAVTGGAGFIGANLVRRLLGDGAGVTVLDDFSTGSEANLAGCAAVVVEGSILDPASLERAMDGADAVVHLAARPSVPRSLEDPVASHHANATGTLLVLEAARRAGSPQVVLASSSSVYGGNLTLPKHEGLRPMPLSPYAASKLAAESYGLAYAHCFDLPVLALRFFNVYGPLQSSGHAYAAVVPAFVSAALGGQDLVVHGDGRQTRDFTFVGSVTSALSAAIHGRVTSSEPVNLAFGTRASLLDVIAELESILGRPVGRTHVAPRAGDVKDSQADDGLLRSLLPSARAVPLRDGLAETVAWSIAPDAEFFG
ncbi:MAG: NAD-dependent epimerase/dehydratase family protein [Acidimicrobiales bacterium]